MFDKQGKDRKKLSSSTLPMEAGTEMAFDTATECGQAKVIAVEDELKEKTKEIKTGKKREEGVTIFSMRCTPAK